MFKFNFVITNPFSNNQNRSSRDYHGSLLIPHKHWELTLFKDNQIVAEVEVGVTVRGDHAPRLEIWLTLLGRGLHFMIYDDRHDDSDPWRSPA